MSASPSSVVFGNSPNTRQDDHHRMCILFAQTVQSITGSTAWTVIWIDEVAFKSDAKAKKDGLSERFKVRVKAYKSSEKCIRAFDKRYKERPPSYGHVQKQIIVVSEGNAEELLDYLHRGKEWLAPKLIILG
ncbi:hypothetical protein FOZ63_014071, partial [Perkinsus olseni]